MNFLLGFLVGAIGMALVGLSLLKLAHAENQALCRAHAVATARLYHRNAIIRRLRANAARLRSIACAGAFQAGQFAAYLAREEHRCTQAIQTQRWLDRQASIGRAHELSTVRYVFSGYFS